MRIVGRGNLGRCADCKFLLECATVYFNTPVGNWNIEKERNDCDGFEAVKNLSQRGGCVVVIDPLYFKEKVDFT